MNLATDPTVLSELRGLPSLEGKGYKLLEDMVAQEFERKCEAGTRFSRLTGNIYTGSLYFNLASYLSNSSENTDQVLWYNPDQESPTLQLRIRSIELDVFLENSVEETFR